MFLLISTNRNLFATGLFNGQEWSVSLNGRFYMDYIPFLFSTPTAELKTKENKNKKA